MLGNNANNLHRIYGYVASSASHVHYVYIYLEDV